MVDSWRCMFQRHNCMSPLGAFSILYSCGIACTVLSRVLCIHHGLWVLHLRANLWALLT